MRRALVLLGLLALALVAFTRQAPEPRSASALPSSPSLAPASEPPANEPAAVAPRSGGVRVTHVIDGDTVILEDGRRIRYIGVDTPEMSDARLSAAAAEARKANQQLVEGTDIRLETDAQEFDRYGRTLAYVWAGDTFVNEELLQEGWARLLTIPPNVRYLDRLRRAAAEGAQRRAEVSGGAVFGAAAENITADCPPGEPVKGNINRAGEKIYHVPEGKFYARTRPEACFADAMAAEHAGYRKSKR